MASNGVGGGCSRGFLLVGCLVGWGAVFSSPGNDGPVEEIYPVLVLIFGGTVLIFFMIRRFQGLVGVSSTGRGRWRFCRVG